ncbi:MAG: hypothetical protein AB7K24_11715 [Gemmataceae bacterium]
MLKVRFPVALIFAGLLAGQLKAQSSASEVQARQNQAALEAAARSNHYAFIYFWKQDDAAHRSMRPVFDATMAKLRGRADGLVINVLAANEKTLVDRFQVSRAPMPLVLAVAPNGAVTKGLHTRFTEQDILTGMVSPGTAGCLKAMQQQRLLLLCVQNESLNDHREALAACQQFRADPRFSQSTDIVLVNPADVAEAKLLNDLQVDPRSPSAVTVFAAPSGKIIGKFVGPVTKDILVSSLQAAQSGQCHGCKDPNCKHCQPPK